MKKILLITLLVILALLPGTAMATSYNNAVPSGSTLLAWTVGPDQGGKKTVISFLYTGGFRASNEIDASFSSSWHSLDDVRPIILAEQEGYGNYLGGTNGVFGSNIKFSDNVLAAMKVQNFNPSQVDGANIPPSSTTLNSDQITWLQKMGYSVQTTSQTASAATPAPTTAPTQTQSKPSTQNTSSKQTSNATSTPVQFSNTNTSTKTSSETVKSDPPVGQTVKTPSGPITPEMVAADQKLVAQNPPSLNPTNIPVTSANVPAKTESVISKYKWDWIAGGVAIIILVSAVSRILYIRKRHA